MAIIVEEEKKKSGNGLASFGWLLIGVILLVGAYFVFFAAPPETSIAQPPKEFAQITSLSQISVSPQDVLSSSQFQGLKQHVAQPATSSPAAVGRSNPFIVP